MNANNEKNTDHSHGLLLFRAGGRLFSLRDEAVIEIAAQQAVTPLPFTPAWVDGLTSIGGRILPQANLTALLGTEAAQDAGELVIINTGASECALKVDEVLARVEIEASTLQSFSEDGSAGSYVCGEWQHQGQVVMLLDIERLGSLFQAQQEANGNPGLLGSLEPDTTTAQAHAMACLVFRMGSERFALRLSDISELSEAPACTTIPGAPALVAGIGTLREEPILLLRTNIMLNIKSDAAQSMLVLERDNTRVGLLVGAVEGIENFSEEQRRELGDHSGDVAAVLHNQHEEVLGLLWRERLMNAQRLQAIRPYLPGRRQHQEQQARVLLQHLQFSIGSESFGIAIESVQRLVSWHPATDTSSSGAVTGLVNIDGDILPVLDRARLHEQLAGDTRPEAWLVLQNGGHQWALAIDHAHAIVDVPADSIEPIGNGSSLVRAVATIGERLLSLLSLTPLTEARPA